MTVHIEEENAIGTLTTLCGDEGHQVATFRLFGQPIADCDGCLKISGANDVIHYEHINNRYDGEPITMCFKRVKRTTFIRQGRPTENVTCKECMASLGVMGMLRNMRIDP